jgi:hypothetical protein
MGECNYYLKARFETAEQAKAAVSRLVALLAEGERAYDYWQGARTREDPPRCEELPTAEEFWAIFREQFPLVCEYLGPLDGAEDWDDRLVGQLGTLVDPQRDRLGDPSSSLVCRGDALFLRLNGIWHFSEMTLLELFCQHDLGAVAVGSISEEQIEMDDDTGADFDPFRLIDV